MPMYLLGIGLGYNKDLFAQAGVTPPTGDRWTWQEFLDASAKLKAAGITPFVGGDKNGYLGAWWFANVGGQQMDSTTDLVNAVIGNVPFTDPKYTGWYKDLEAYVKGGNVNDDVMSLDLDQGVRLFSQGKGAMAFGTDGIDPAVDQGPRRRQGGRDAARRSTAPASSPMQATRPSRSRSS